MKRIIVLILLTVALTVVCLGIGAVVFFALNGGFPTNNPFDLQNIASSLEESQTVKIDPQKPLTLKVIDEAGGVTVTGGDVKTVEIKATKTAYDSTQARADEEVKGMRFSVEQNGNALTVRYELPKSINIRNNVNTVDFVITVPTGTAVEVSNSTGDVNLSNLEGNVKLDVSFGTIRLDNLAGAVDVNSNGGEITASGLQAGTENISLHSDFGALTLEKANAQDISVTSNSGELKLTEVRAEGKLETKTDFGTTSYVNGSALSLSIKTNGGDVSVEKVTVVEALTVEDDFGQINLIQAAAGAYDLKTNGGSINIDGAAGTLKAHTDFGKITIKNATDVTLDLQSNGGDIEFSGSLGAGPHSVSTDFGAVTLTLPADSALNVDINTSFGKVRSDLPIAVVLSGDANQESGDDITGTINGGGAALTVKTNGGNISLNTGK